MAKENVEDAAVLDNRNQVADNLQKNVSCCDIYVVLCTIVVIKCNLCRKHYTMTRSWGDLISRLKLMER